MVYCVAVNCKNGSCKSQKKSQDKVGFFSFPKDESLKRIWVTKVRRQNWKPSKSSKLCSDHFEESSFVQPLAILKSINWTAKKLELKPDAVPTLFTYTNEKKRKPKERSAFAKRRRHEIVNELIEITDSLPPASTPASTQCENHTVSPVDTFSNVCRKVCLFLKSGFCERWDYKKKEVATQTNKKKLRHVRCQANICPTSSKRSQTDIIFKIDASTETEREDNEQQSQGSEIHVDYIVESEPSQPSDKSSASDHSECTIFGDEEMEFESGNTEKNACDSTERKFIVFESCLKQLLSCCHGCFCTCDVSVNYVIGSMVSLKATCSCGFTSTWNSQPTHGKMPLGNLHLAAGILFSGSSPSKVLQLFHHIGVECISTRTYNYLQSAYLIPSVNKVWAKQQESLFAGCQGKFITLGGDGRCDSPGFCAKYGSYTCMDLDTNKILDQQLIQSNEVGYSGAMELEGLKRCFNKFKTHGIQLKELVTDRHVQIKKYMREEHADVEHHFDVWHVAKGINKKILAAGKKKGCQLLSQWAQSISNHTYWCAATSQGDGEILKSKWLSLLNHVADIHHGHDENFPQCDHDPIAEPRKWFKRDTKPFMELEAIVKSRYLLNDITKLSYGKQTFNLESYHRVVLMFAPKHTHFFFEAMQARLFLAALHFNENGNKAQKVIQEGDHLGERIWRLSYPKSRTNGVVKAVKADCTYGYVKELIAEVLSLRMQYPTYEEALAHAKENVNNPKTLTSSLSNKLQKAVAVESHVTRFNI